MLFLLLLPLLQVLHSHQVQLQRLFLGLCYFLYWISIDAGMLTCPDATLSNWSFVVLVVVVVLVTFRGNIDLTGIVFVVVIVTVIPDNPDCAVDCY